MLEIHDYPPIIADLHFAKMAQPPAQEEWSCPLCTLLNRAKDERCAACDNKRPPTYQIRDFQSLEPSLATATAPNVQLAIRSTTGVFFSSLPRNQWTSDASCDWRQEARLLINRRRGNGRVNMIIDRERGVESESVVTGTIEQNADSTGTNWGLNHELKALNVVHSISDAVESMVTTKNEMESQDEEEMAMEEPCFDLLGSVAAVFNAPVANDKMDDTEKISNKTESAEVDADNKVMVVSSPSRYLGVIPTSKVNVKELAIEEKLACAGLNLSDSEEEEEKEPSLQLRQQKEKKESEENEWVCQICTTLNGPNVLECISCSCTRYIDALHEVNTGTGSQLRWACHICTSLNPPDLTDCLMCRSTRKVETGASESCSDKTWTCSLCTTLNAPDITRCEVCDRLREEGPTHYVGKGRECLVCTNINSPRSTRCEICETCLPTDKTPDNHCVDLSVSSPALKASTAYQVDLENPYVDLSQYCDASNEGADLDDIDEISDHEPSMSLVNQRPLKTRPELTRFEHFVCIEDLRGDGGCRINYNKMFAGQRSNKSYADRLATRQAQSKKRKQASVRKEAGKTPTFTSRSGKAVRGSNKRKVPAAQRGGEKVPRTKKARKTGVSARPTSSTTTFSPAINHYDDSAATLGEDLSTMAWEGVGSAGYT